MAIINLSHRGDTSFDKLLGHLLVFKKMECIGRYIKMRGNYLLI